MRAHPLEGKKEADIQIFDPEASKKLYGTEPVFIFDPNDDSNCPVPWIPNHDTALRCWKIYPKFIQKLFERSFTDGIKDPLNGRVRETEWRAGMIQLRDLILYCGSCGAQNFYDPEIVKTSAKSVSCWACHKDILLPSRIQIGRSLVMLNHDTKHYPHHVDTDRLYDLSTPLAAIAQHPKNPGIWGLKNISKEKWTVTTMDGRNETLEPGRSTTLKAGTKINFGKKIGEIT